GGSGSSSDDDTFDITADLNWNLFNGFQDINAYWRDTFVIQQRRSQLRSFQESLLLDAAAVYYQILRSEAQVRVLENSLQVQEARLRDTRGQLQAGVGVPLEVAQSEAQTSATRVLLINARRDVATARELLAFLTAAPVRDAPLTDGFELPAEVDPLDDYLTTALAAREDFAAAELALQAARRNVEVAVGQYYPSVALDLSAFLHRETLPTARDWDALLGVNFPIFAAGRIRADVREAWSFVREALLVRSLTLRRVEQQVRDAYEELRASERRLAELQVALRAAEQAFRQAEVSYRIGLATNLDRIAAQ